MLNYNLILPINVSWYFIPNTHSSQRAKATRLLTGNAPALQFEHTSNHTQNKRAFRLKSKALLWSGSQVGTPSLSSFHSLRAGATSSNSQKARSRHYLPNKKHPSSDECSLWSGRRGSNSRHPPWQGGILPLNYPRIFGLLLYSTC